MMKIFLYPLAFFYGIIIYFRNRMYDLNILKSTDFEIPVISVGNITVGGTGKTPHTEYMINLLKKDFRVVALSRGYKRKTKGFREVLPDSTALEAGDEPLQMKNKYKDVGIYVDEKRVHGIQQIIQIDQDALPDVVLLDDAFQHRKVNPGINILLIDYNQPISNDKLLPVGRLRERHVQVRRANVIILTKCPDEVTPIKRRIFMKEFNLRPYQTMHFTKMDYGQMEAVFPDETNVFDLMKPHANPSVLVVTGIANPQPLKNHIASFSAEVKDLTFPDHHLFTAVDIRKIEQTFNEIADTNKLIITTEKDAMRLKDMDLSDVLKANLFYIPIKISFLDSEGKSFDDKILNYVRENKSNRELYKRKSKKAY